VDCVNACSTQTCVSACPGAHPSGQNDYQLLVGCMTTTCAAACSSGTGGSGGSSCGAIASPCNHPDDCCNGYCCAVYSKNTCRKNIGQSCNSGNECCTGSCGFGTCY
jgi:hypothetical protein